MESSGDFVVLCSLFYRCFLFTKRFQGKIDAVKHKANAEHREHHHEGHDLIGEERENAGLDKEPVIPPVIDRIAEGRPHKDHEDAHKLLPYLANVVDHISVGKVQNAPAEQEAVVHKGLENDVAKGWLTAQGCTGVAHPHEAGGDGKGDHRLTQLGKLGIELDKWHQHCHNGANIKGKLVGADSVITIGERHNEKVNYIQADSQVCHNILQSGLLLGEFAAKQRQRQRAPKDNK